MPPGWDGGVRKRARARQGPQVTPCPPYPSPGEHARGPKWYPRAGPGVPAHDRARILAPPRLAGAPRARVRRRSAAVCVWGGGGFRLRSRRALASCAVTAEGIHGPGPNEDSERAAMRAAGAAGRTARRGGVARGAVRGAGGRCSIRTSDCYREVGRHEEYRTAPILDYAGRVGTRRENAGPPRRSGCRMRARATASSGCTWGRHGTAAGWQRGGDAIWSGLETPNAAWSWRRRRQVPPASVRKSLQSLSWRSIWTDFILEYSMSDVSFSVTPFVYSGEQEQEQSTDYFLL